MMIKPGISELSKKVDSRYTLVSMAAKRVRMLAEKQQTEDVKVISAAVDEIISGKVQYCRGEEAMESNSTSFGADAVYVPSEPSSDLNLEALKYELEVAANEERMEKERMQRENAETAEED